MAYVSKNSDKAESEKERKASGCAGCLVIFVIVAAIIAVFSLLSGKTDMNEQSEAEYENNIKNRATSMEEISSGADFEAAITEIVGEDNIREVSYYEALETVPSTLNVRFVVTNYLTEIGSVKIFTEYCYAICRELSQKSDVDNIRLFGLIELIDSAGNVTEENKVFNFTSKKDERSGVDWELLKDDIVLDYRNINKIGDFSMDGWMMEKLEE